jgi:transcription elongation factor GreA
VGSHQGDPEHGRIAYDSPLGRAVCGHRAGDVVDVVAPIGLRHARIVTVGDCTRRWLDASPTMPS